MKTYIVEYLAVSKIHIEAVWEGKFGHQQHPQWTHNAHYLPNSRIYLKPNLPLVLMTANAANSYLGNINLITGASIRKKGLVHEHLIWII